MSLKHENEREPELEEIDEYTHTESPQKRELVNWILLGILAVIALFGVWEYQELKVAQDRNQAIEKPAN